MPRESRSGAELWVCHMGVVPYRDALAIQRRLRARRLAGALPDVLLLLEHPPVYTRGRRSDPGDLPLGDEHYRELGIDVVDTERGGRVTFHAPGQLVGYPIMAVEDINRFLRVMEGALIDALGEEGILARSRHDEGIDYTGVWVQRRKIASIGLHISRGVSAHGFALNVDNDLEPFGRVVACGLPDVPMTSVARELPPGRRAGLACMRRRVAFAFAAAHGRRQRLVGPVRLGIDPGAVAPAERAAEAVPA